MEISPVSNSPDPRKTVPGKWVVIIMMPIVLITFVWLAYTRVNFVHPSSLSTRTSPAKQ